MIKVKNEALPIFTGRLSLCFADSPEEIQNYYKDEVFDEIETAHGLATILNWRGKVTFVLCIICNKKCKPSIGVIAHEAIHIAQFICNHINHEAKPEADEIYSHLTAYITERYILFLKSINEYNKFNG